MRRKQKRKTAPYHLSTHTVFNMTPFLLATYQVPIMLEAWALRTPAPTIQLVAVFIALIISRYYAPGISCSFEIRQL